MSARRHLVLATALASFVVMSACSGSAGSASAPTTAASTTTTTPPLVAPTLADACTVLDPTELSRIYGSPFPRTGTPGKGSGWIVSQCSWRSADGASVSLALGSAASLGARGYTGTVGDFVRERETNEGKQFPVKPLEQVGEGGYVTETVAPKLVAYRADVILQLLSVNPNGELSATQLIEVARAGFKALAH